MNGVRSGMEAAVSTGPTSVRLAADRSTLSALEREAAEGMGSRVETFKQIGDELRSVYSIGYYSTNKTPDNTFRKVAVEAHTPGVTIRAKSGYYAR